jgi:hypothetical protein
VTVTNYPFAMLLLAVGSLGFAVLVGDILRRNIRALYEEERKDFEIVLGSTLTLLALLIGFTFSMAVSRYDQRKTYEEQEANAIGTEYLRADLLPQASAARVREFLRRYLEQRIAFYTERDPARALQIEAATAARQHELWSAALSAPAAEVTIGQALALAGMNDVLNAEGYTEAAWRNRIPVAAWTLMASIAVVCCLMLGYGARRKDWRMLLIVPVVVAIAFFLISDLDSPWGGAIRVAPVNLESLAGSLPPTGASAHP